MVVQREGLDSITADSTAQAVADSTIGDKYIQITTGSNAQRIQPGGEIPYKTSPDLVKSMDLSQFRQSLEKMDALLTDIESGQSLLGQFVLGDKMYRDLQTRTAELQRGIHRAVATTGTVGRELYTDLLYRDISTPLVELDESLAKLQSGQGALGQLLRDNAEYDQFHAQVTDLRQTIAGFRSAEFLR